MHCSRDVIECAFISPHVVSSPKCSVLLSCPRSFPVWRAACVSVATCSLHWISRECPCFHHPPTSTHLQEEGGATGFCHLPLLLLQPASPPPPRGRPRPSEAPLGLAAPVQPSILPRATDSQFLDLSRLSYGDLCYSILSTCLCIFIFILFFLKTLNFLIEVELIYSVSGVQQSDSVMHIYLYILFQILFHYRLL